MKGGKAMRFTESDIKITYRTEGGDVHTVLTLGNHSITCDDASRADSDYRESVNELLEMAMCSA